MKAAGVAELRAEGRIGVHKAGTAKATAAADLWAEGQIGAHEACIAKWAGEVNL